MAATPVLAGNFIDPTKQAEYPIVLGDKLAGKKSARDTRFINVVYNYKSKGGSSRQKTTITAGDSPGLYKLTIRDKAGDAEQTNLTYLYNGSVDPALSVSDPETSNMVLIFDPQRKAFVLEPVSTRLHFNLRSAPGKTDKQLSEQYPPLNVLSANEVDFGGDEEANKDDNEPLGTADEDNPYDFRHFLTKKKQVLPRKKPGKTPLSKTSVPSPVEKRSATHLTPSTAAAAKPRSKPPPKAKPRANPLRTQKKPVSKPTPVKPETSPPKPKVADPDDIRESIEQPEEPRAESPAASDSAAGGNIIVDGDLIIDMGSPPPERRKFKLDPRDFASGNTSVAEADNASDDNDYGDSRSPSPPRLAGSRAWANQRQQQEDEEDDEGEEEPSDDEIFEGVHGADDDMVDDDGLAAEMEKAFEESVRQEEEAQQRLLQQQQHVVSEDESEVSEEE